MWESCFSTKDSLTELLEAPDCSVNDVLLDPNLQIDFKKQVPELIDYLNFNLKQLIEISIEPNSDSDSMPLRQSAFLILLAMAQTIPLKLLKNNILFSEIDRYLEGNNQTAMVILSRLFLTLTHYSQGAFLTSLPNKQKFMKHLISKISSTAIYTYLYTFIAESSNVTISFFEESHAIEYVLSSIESNGTNERLFIILNSLLIETPSNSKLLLGFKDTRILSKILEYGLNSSIIISENAFNILTTLCHKLEDINGFADEENSLFEFIFVFLVDNITRICKFIMESPKFLQGQGSATNLLCVLCQRRESITSSVIDLIGYMFDQLFILYYHTKMHHCFKNLFTVILLNYPDCKTILNKYRMRERIMGATRNAGMFHALASLIHGWEVDNSENGGEEWDSFLKTQFTELEAMFANEYGGPLPTDSLFSSDSDDYSFPLKRKYDFSSSSSDDDSSEDSF